MCIRDRLRNEYPQNEYIVTKVTTEVENVLSSIYEAIDFGLQKSTEYVDLPKAYSKCLAKVVVAVGRTTDIKPYVNTLYSGDDKYTSYLNIGQVTDKYGYTYEQLLVVLSSLSDSEFRITTLNRFHEPGAFTIGTLLPDQLEQSLLTTFNLA